MADIPDAVADDIAAAIEDYRTITPPEQATPRGAADLAVQYLLSSGWHISPPPDTGTRPATA